MGSSVPEPERFVVVNHLGEVIGYGIGSDTTARQLESLSPLYLPAAKTYFGSTTMYPWVTLFEEKPEEVTIRMSIERRGSVVYNDSYGTDQMKRSVESLVHHARTLLLNIIDGSAPAFLLFTGTGIVPGVEFSLQEGDEVTIDGGVLGQVRCTCHVARVK
jgi:2-dehydro-3-deoxy-D-arabinonate dehydratase